MTFLFATRISLLRFFSYSLLNSAVLSLIYSFSTLSSKYSLLFFEASFISFIVLFYVDVKRYIIFGFLNESGDLFSHGIALASNLSESFFKFFEFIDFLSKMIVDSTFTLVLHLCCLVFFSSDLFLGYSAYTFFSMSFAMRSLHFFAFSSYSSRLGLARISFFLGSGSKTVSMVMSSAFRSYCGLYRLGFLFSSGFLRSFFGCCCLSTFLSSTGASMINLN